MRASLLVIVLSLIASGCETTSLSEADCNTRLWNPIGYLDGVDGLSHEHGEIRVRDCARFYIALDAALYEEGRLQGLTVFCTPRGALDAGKRRVGDISLCDSTNPTVTKAHRIGNEYGRATKYLRAAERERVASPDESIERCYDRINDLSSELDNTDTQEEKERLESEIDSLHSEIIAIENAEFGYERSLKKYNVAKERYDKFLAEINGFEE